MRNLSIALIAFAFSSQVFAAFPKNWFEPVKDPKAPKWEILPQAAKKGEVILSKRNELGMLSNFAATPFTLDGKRYGSVEGFWQAMKYPENKKDVRAQAEGIDWKYTRQQVEQLTAFQAKRAGKPGSKAMKKLGINWVTYQGKKITYRTQEKGPHYDLIKRAMRAKMEQNPKVKQLLLKTGDLKLLPDHKSKKPTPPAWRYYDIWMEFRAELRKSES